MDEFTALPDLASRAFGGGVVLRQRRVLRRRRPPGRRRPRRCSRRRPSTTRARSTTAGRPAAAASPATTRRSSGSARPASSTASTSTRRSSPATTRRTPRSTGCALDGYPDADAARRGALGAAGARARRWPATASNLFAVDSTGAVHPRAAHHLSRRRRGPAARARRGRCPTRGCCPRSSTWPPPSTAAGSRAAATCSTATRRTC